jgi:hypothetical protein
MSSATETAKTTKLTVDLKVEIDIQWDADDIQDVSYLGKYTDTDEEGAIDRTLHGSIDTSRQMRYFVPENNRTHKPKDWEHVPGKEKAALIKKHGSLKNVDRFYRLQDYKRMEAFNDGEWNMQECVVVVKLGSLEARASLCGIESDSGDKYMKTVEGDLRREALCALRKKIMDRITVE